MSTTIDQLKELGQVAGQAARFNLLRSGDLVPVLMLVRDGEVKEIMAVPPHPTALSKQNAYGLMAMVIAKKAPDAVILVNDAYMRVLKKEEAETFMDGYDNGSLATDFEAVESILIAFKGPSIPTHLLAFPYHRNELGEIVFDPHESLQDWNDGAAVNLLPDWWES